MSAVVCPIPPSRTHRRPACPADVLPFPFARSPGFVGRAVAMLAAEPEFADVHLQTIVADVVTARLLQGFRVEAVKDEAEASSR